MERLLFTMVLVLFAVQSALAAKTGLPEPVVPDCLGVNIHFVGSEKEQVDQIAEGGFRYIRMDCFWSNVEREKGKYDFKPYDELLASLKAKGIRPLFILCYGNPHYDNGMAPYTDEGRKGYCDFAKAAAAHFRGEGVLWEIWNEPNGINFWRPEPNVDDYVKLAREAYSALKEADPACTVLAPALAGWDFTYLEAAFSKGLLECTDVVSVHPYGAAKPEDAAAYYRTVRELLSKYAPKGRHYPVVSGEWGYSSSRGLSVERQGEFLARQFICNLMNDVRLSIWYDWRDDGPDPDEPEHHFGTVYLDSQPKPAYLAMQTLSKHLGGYSFAGRLSTGSALDYLVLFRKGADLRLAAWTTGKPHRVEIPVDVDRFEVVSLTGEVASASAAGGKLKLDLTGAVSYIKPLAAGTRWSLEAEWNVSARTMWVDGALMAEIVSESPIAGVLKVTGDGVTLAEIDQPKSVTLRTPYTGSDGSRCQVTVTIRSPQLDQPLVRTIDLDTSAVPVLEVLPSNKNEIVLSLTRPASRSADPLAGFVSMGDMDGVELAKPRQAFALASGERGAVLRFPTIRKPAQPHSFSLVLEDENGDKILSIPARKYAIVEVFTEGTPGSEVVGCSARLDGDPEVPAEAALVYADATEGGPGGICARLDYSFGGGWRSVRIVPDQPIPIPGKPHSAKMWVKGDGSLCAARLRYVDAANQTFQPDYAKLDFTEWRCPSAVMSGIGCGHWGGRNDGLVEYPTRWDSVFLLDSPGGRKAHGSVYLGPMMLCYD